jgi:glycosyltransferase involved in cell wall biosynthesis
VSGPVTVAIPVRNGGPLLGEVLAAVRAQRIDREVELLVADSGSTDGSAELARSFGATVFAVERFSHGGTRNELMARSRGTHVAFLTQDALPADERWLERLLAGFALADDVALVCGPYRARAGAPVAVKRELSAWFASLAPDGVPRLVRTTEPYGPGPATFFTDANGAVARAAWERVPFRHVPYAEDQALSLDMLRAGYAKAFMPDAVVVHSHEYGVVAQFRRSFDEWRGLREIHGFVQPADPLATLRSIQSSVRADARSLRGAGAPARAVARETARSLRHWTVRAAGAAAGSRADRLPPAVRRWFSLERRATFEPAQKPPASAR